MNAVFSRKWTLRFLFALGCLYVLGGCSGIILASLLRAGYGPSIFDQHTTLSQGVVWISLGFLSLGAAWSLLKGWVFSVPAARVAVLAVLAWEAWVLYWAVRGTGSLTDYWMDIIAVSLAACSLVSSFRPVQVTS
jgi:hypothetical protein